ncbi:Fc.00g065980.m01.CDS01 [Cosmosporella sp. VM-42]
MSSITPETTIVLVTGANQGIGLEVVKKLTAEHPDYHVILCGRRPDAVQEALKPLQDQGLNVSSLIMDLTSDESIKAAAKEVDSKFGRLDVLINNGAISGYGIDGERERMRAVYDTNVIGTAIVTNEFLPILAKSTKTKRVVFVSSTLGSLSAKSHAITGGPHRKNNYGVYTHSKSALNMLALHYAVDHENDKTWKFNIADPGHYCGTTLNNFQGNEDSALGAISICEMATLGPDGMTGLYVNDQGTVPW